LPDPQRPLRGLTRRRPLSRVVTHVAVIGLVAFASAFGIAAVRGQAPATSSGSANRLLPFDLVARVRGAADVAPVARSTVFDLEGGRVDPRLQSRAVHLPPSPEATPLPTPVPPPPPATEQPAVAVAPPPVIVRGTGVLLWPVHGVITTYYSAAHLAIDIAVPYGTTVAAADAGTVVSAGWRNNGGGLVVEIDHGNGIQPPQPDLRQCRPGRGPWRGDRRGRLHRHVHRPARPLRGHRRRGRGQPAALPVGPHGIGQIGHLGPRPVRWRETSKAAAMIGAHVR
jgi:Peptidase family M23